MTLGQRIRKRREELGLSQTELSERLGFKSRSSVNKIEMDVQAPRQKIIKALADALDTTVGYILGIDEETEQNERELCDLFSLCHGRDSYDVVQKYLRLDSNDRAVVSTMIDSMLSTEKYRQEAKNA